MKPTHRLLTILLTLLILTLACDLSPAPSEPTANNDAAVGTSVAETVAANETLSALIPTDTSPPPTDTVPAPTATPDPFTVVMPVPIPAPYSGLIWDAGNCYDYDTLQQVSASDPTADACLDANSVITPANGGLMSGRAPFDPPSLGYCLNESDLLPDQVAPQTDLYLCVQTNLGAVGILVGRDFDFTNDRMVFDLYLFP